MSRRGLLPLLSVALTTVLWAVPPARWNPYKNDPLAFTTQIPADWEITSKGNAVAFTSSIEDKRISFGILKATEKKITIEQAVNVKFEAAGKPAEWQRSPARFGGARAIKVVGADRKDPDNKAVQYFVEKGDGYYYVQLSAPRAQWAEISPTFNRIIAGFQFTTDAAETNDLLKALE